MAWSQLGLSPGSISAPTKSVPKCLNDENRLISPRIFFLNQLKLRRTAKYKQSHPPEYTVNVLTHMLSLCVKGM